MIVATMEKGLQQIRIRVAPFTPTIDPNVMLASMAKVVDNLLIDITIIQRLCDTRSSVGLEQVEIVVSVRRYVRQIDSERS